MEIKALIVEQLEENGTLKTFRMSPDYNKPLIVAFAEEYEETRNGPFHFIDESYEKNFTSHFAKMKTRKLGKYFFTKLEEIYNFKSNWAGIPTSRGALTYYALMLPKYAIPRKISITNPYSENEYKKYVYRDDEKSRYIIYLECKSSYGEFKFDTNIDFIVLQEKFSDSSYKDKNLVELYGRTAEMYQNFDFVDEKNITIIKQKFTGETIMGDKYEAGQVGAQGPNAHVHDINFNQIWEQNKENLDIKKLNSDLVQLREALQKEASTAEHYSEIGAIANSELEIKKENGEKALEALAKTGKWSLSIAEKVGVPIAVSSMKAALGL